MREPSVLSHCMYRKIKIDIGTLYLGSRKFLCCTHEKHDTGHRFNISTVRIITRNIRRSTDSHSSHSAYEFVVEQIATKFAITGH